MDTGIQAHTSHIFRFFLFPDIQKIINVGNFLYFKEYKQKAKTSKPQFNSSIKN